MPRTARTLRHFRPIGATAVAGLFVIVTGLLSLNPVAAQTPTPGPGHQPQVWPYRFTVSGHATAVIGDVTTYRVNYELLDPATRFQPGFVVMWGEEKATFEFSEVVVGPPGVMSPMASDTGLVLGVRWDFSGPSERGAVDVTLRINPGSKGDLRVFMYVPGTDIVLPEGTVRSVTTSVASTLPNGGGPPDVRFGRNEWLVLTGLILTGLGAASGWLAARARRPV